MKYRYIHISADLFLVAGMAMPSASSTVLMASSWRQPRTWQADDITLMTIYIHHIFDNPLRLST